MEHVGFTPDTGDEPTFSMVEYWNKGRNGTMYYPDGTTYEKVDRPCRPVQQNTQGGGIYLVLFTRTRGQSCLYWYTWSRTGLTVRRDSTLVPSFMTERETGLDTWSCLL